MPKPTGDVAATVNGRPIVKAEVEATVDAAVQGRPLASDERTLALAEALARHIDRSLVEGVLGPVKASPRQVDAAVENLKKQLERQKLTLDQFLAQRKLTEQQLRAQLAWQVGWHAYLDEHLSDDALQKYFDAHHREFDGTRLRASHVLLRPAKAGQPLDSPELLQQAADLRRQIIDGKLTFAEAATRHSAGPSRHKGGDLGFIPRRGVMAEAFGRAAFALKKDEISQPVVSSFGVHLIRITDERTGDKQFADVRDELRGPAAEALFDELAARERRKAKIEFSPGVPHFKPGTRELAKP